MFPGGQTYQEGHSPLTQFLISSYLDSAHNTSWCVSAWVSIPVGGGGAFTTFWVHDMINWACSEVRLRGKTVLEKSHSYSVLKPRAEREGEGEEHMLQSSCASPTF